MRRCVVMWLIWMRNLPKVMFVATGWLRENLQQFGGLREPRDTITHAAGSAPHQPLMTYLEAKFSEIYNL